MGCLKPHYFIAVLALAATSCSAPTAPDSLIPIDRLQTDAYSGFTEPTRLVILDDASWRDSWITLLRFTTPAQGAPEIDFSRDMVVIVATGSQPSSGYSVTIESAVEHGDAIVLAVLTTAPGPGCAGLAVITNPVDVIRLPRHATVSFVERKQVQNCS